MTLKATPRARLSSILIGPLRLASPRPREVVSVPLCMRVASQITVTISVARSLILRALVRPRGLNNGKSSAIASPAPVGRRGQAGRLAPAPRRRLLISGFISGQNAPMPLEAYPIRVPSSARKAKPRKRANAPGLLTIPAVEVLSWLT